MLPKGWSTAVDPASGDTYYSNDYTGETTWEKPRAFDGETPFEVAQAMKKAKADKQRKKLERQMEKLRAKKVKEAEKLQAKQAAKLEKKMAKQKKGGGKDKKKKKKR